MFGSSVFFEQCTFLGYNYMLDAGENPKTVQEFVGHADPGFMLRQYAHVLEQSKKRASDTLMRTLFGQKV